MLNMSWGGGWLEYFKQAREKLFAAINVREAKVYIVVPIV